MDGMVSESFCRRDAECQFLVVYICVPVSCTSHSQTISTTTPGLRAGIPRSTSSSRVSSGHGDKENKLASLWHRPTCDAIPITTDAPSEHPKPPKPPSLTPERDLQTRAAAAVRVMCSRGCVVAYLASTMKTRVLLSSIFFIADSVVRGYLRICGNGGWMDGRRRRQSLAHSLACVHVTRTPSHPHAHAFTALCLRLCTSRHATPCPPLARCDGHPPALPKIST